MKSIPLHRVALVRPFANFLEDIGAPVERGFRQAGLPYCALENVDNYVPSNRFYAFLLGMAQSEGIADLGFRAGQRFAADNSDPCLKGLLQQSPTFYRGLLRASELFNRTISNSRVGILQPPCCEYTYFYHRPSCDADSPAIGQIGWFGLNVMMGVVRAFTDPQWQPAEIGVMTNHTPSLYVREQFPDTRVRLSQQCSYIALDNELLSLPPLPDKAAKLASLPPRYSSLPNDFVTSLEKVLISYLQEGDLTIELAAGLSGMSKRTLQRKLTELGTHYSETLDHARFRAASQMLRNTGKYVTEIALRLGYSDAAHFSRAFRRIAGVTPRAYRRQSMS